MSPDPEPMPLDIGTALGPYQIVAPLGAGGMGEVYRARDDTLGRDVALKLLPATFTDDPQRAARFRLEARLLAALSHPNIGAIYGFEESAGRQFLVLELIEGDTLAERIATGPIALPSALPIARQIAEAVQTAHEKGIVHRDLKPANIKITPGGTVKVLDFGLAKSGVTMTSDATPTMPAVCVTQSGTILGTTAYMSPERAGCPRVRELLPPACWSPRSWALFS